MSTRSRIVAYGSCAALVAIGAVVAGVAGGATVQAIGFVVATLGLGGALLLVFYEIGLSEDRDRARDDEARKSRRTGPRHQPRQPMRRRWPRRPG